MGKNTKKGENNQKQTNPFSEMEEEVLDFWEKNKIFEKSVENSPKPHPTPLLRKERETKKGERKDYVFYDGPPFGTGEPHYGHILSSVSKDVVPRYWTMRGFRVERRWGWDCHGLPIENIIEADMKISGKKQIEEEVGVANFNEACRARVLEYADIWGKMVRRIGRWVDFKNSYKTMDLTFMESVWWGFKEMWNKELVYEGRKVLLYCPRCETPISNFEVAMDNSYKDITDTSVYVKFKVKNAEEKLGIRDDVYLLAWTTTPWTLPGNVALAVGEKIDYLKIRERGTVSISPVNSKSNYKLIDGNTCFIVAKNIFIKEDQKLNSKTSETYILHGKTYEVIGEFKGKDLVNLELEYEPLFNIPAVEESGNKAHYVVAGDFVTTDDGTGIVHIAPVYGEEDYKIGLEHKLPIIPLLDSKGHFNSDAPEFLRGAYFKKANNLIIENLRERKILFAEENVTHSYPHCHRCETPLYYSAIPAWFINIDKIRKRMLELNENINWFPKHLKHGRFAKGIEQAPDWNISRNRFFATPIPVWKCEKCEAMEIIGGVQELEEKSGRKNIQDIHSHFIDDISWPCKKCSGGMKRIREVFDCWVESGSMPYAQMHYPFENKEKFEKNFPAQFISEYISQTRAWFYVMHAISTSLFDKNSFENVATTGVILNEKGEKMSKSKKNFPDPYKVINQYGADALRLYLMSSPVMQAENLFFSEDGVKEIFRKNVMTLWNVYKFFELFTNGHELKTNGHESNNVLDRWILMRLNQLIKEVTDGMDNYNLPKATRPIEDFINDFSTWYLRRSRERFKNTPPTPPLINGGNIQTPLLTKEGLGEVNEDKQAALETTKFVLLQLSKIIAPFMPFMAENLWQKVSGNDFKDEDKSVHLEGWPSQLSIINYQLSILEEMEVVRKIVELGLAERDRAGIKVRQPLQQLTINNLQLAIKDEFLDLVKDEVNVKNIKIEKGEGGLSVELDTEITFELKLEGVKRELVRFINNLRKDVGLTIKDRAIIYYETESKEIKEAFKKLGEEILRDTLSDEIVEGVDKNIPQIAAQKRDADSHVGKKEIKVNNEAIILGIKKK